MTRFSGPDDSPGFLLWRVTLAWQRAMRAALAPHDLTHVQFVLLASLWWLVSHNGPPSQQQLASHAGTDPMMTSQVLRKLEDRGFVSRSVDPADSRARLLELTSAGKALVSKAMKDVEDADVAYFAGLGSEQQAFIRGLTRLL
ncbi:MarR family transcriptional regulator [Lentzea sp. NPDC051838]|uniref:MarR family winged helix-turn-helix transcriptional regulator n=1 Tax=Lentzea sp. NPDC051838 TaxID=3154849 RepID=UPI0034316A02